MTSSPASRRLLALLLPAAGAAAVLAALLTGDGDTSELGVGFGAWMFSPYAALAVVLLAARRSPSRAFWWTAVGAGAVVLVATVLTAWAAVAGTDAMSGVPLFLSPLVTLPLVAAVGPVGLVLHLVRCRSARGGPQGQGASGPLGARGPTSPAS